MLLDPIYYKETIKDLSLEELYQEENRLREEINYYKKNKKVLEQELVHPSPKLVYQMNKEYWKVVRDLIVEKTNYEK